MGLRMDGISCVVLVTLLVSVESMLADVGQTRLLKIEHMYCDRPPADRPLRADEPSLVAKAVCKGVSCPELHGKQVVLVECAWPSVNGVPVYVEETSGWYFFWKTPQFKEPLVPTVEEWDGIKKTAEQGYLNKHHAGSMKLAI